MDKSISQTFDLPTRILQEKPFVAGILLVLGGFSVARLAYQTLSVLLQTFVLSGSGLKKFGAGKGSWAVITGASDGIGLEFAFQLAKSGLNVFLVSRNEGKLKQVASEIESKYPGTKTGLHAIDFATADEEAYRRLENALAELETGVLVNNVGKSHNMPVNFWETPKGEIKDIVSINVVATLRVTHAILPCMIRQKRGLILNIGSFAGSVPSPMLATYSGTKAFLSTFTAALSAELSTYNNITVQHLNTYFVTSKLSKIRKSSALIPTPKAYVASALNKIGLGCGAAYSGRMGTSTPFWSHAMLDYGMTLIGMPSLFIGYTLSLHKSIRKRALKKLEREAKAQ